MKAQRVGRPEYWPFTFPSSPGKCHRVLCAVCAEDVLALRSWRPMYLHPGNSIRLWQVLVALVFLLAVSALVVVLLASPLPRGRLAVVSGNHGAHDRPHAGWKTIHGRPLCLPSLSGPVHHALLGSGRLGPGPASSCGVAAGDEPGCGWPVWRCSPIGKLATGPTTCQSGHTRRKSPIEIGLPTGRCASSC